MKTFDQKLAMASIIIDTFGIILSVILSITNSNKFFWIVIALLIVVNLSLIWLFIRTKQQLNMFKVILSNKIPLYGLLNYLFKKNDESGTQYINNLKITSLSLTAKIAGDIVENKDNDLMFKWKIDGCNTEEEEVNSFYIRIGADSSIRKDDIIINALDCTNCKDNSNCLSCKLSDEETINRKMFVEIEFETRTYRILKINFTNPIKQGYTFSVRLKYVWPQCYNSVCDFLLIDPNNFSTSIDSVSTELECDNKIIKKHSQVNLAELDKTSAKTNFVKKLEYKDDSFKYTFTPKNKKIYYLVILNDGE